MSQIEDFIASARAKNIPDETIRASLKEQGWQDEVVNLALVGLSVPRPVDTTSSTAPTVGHRPSLSPLMAALHHVLLWFFSAASTFAIAGVTSSLFGGRVSTEALAALIAVSVVTFTPYAIFYIKYLRSVRLQPEIVPGRTWSIITICLHSVGAISATITLVVSLILDASLSVIVSAILIAVLNIIIVTTYALAAFSKPDSRRRLGLKLHLILLGVLLGGLFIASLIRLVPAQADEKTRENLVEAVDSIRQYASNRQALPENEASVNLPSGIDYQKIGPIKYEVCADFKLDTSRDDDDYDYISERSNDDSYVSEYDFNYHKSGRDCFEFESRSLERLNNRRNNVDIYYQDF